jgi:hypothetical protein
MIDVPIVERARLLLERRNGDRRPRSEDARIKSAQDDLGVM